MRIESWYDDKNFKPAKKDGTLPLTRTGAAFRYRRAIIWSFDVGVLLSSGGIHGGSFTIELVDGDNVLFKSKVTFKIFFIANVLLYSWNYLNRDLFETSIVGGVPTTPETIGFYLDSGEIGDTEQGDMQPASDSGSAYGEISIIADWLSPIYYFNVHGARSIPVGAKVRISHDSFDFAPGSVEYSFAFLDGGLSPVSTTFDPFGALVSAIPSAQTVNVGRAWRPDIYRDRAKGGIVEGQSPTIHVLPNGVQILAIQQNAGVVEMQSLDAGWTSERVKYNLPSGADLTAAQVVFEGDVTMPTSILLPDTSRLHLAVEGDEVIVRIVDKFGVGDKSIVGPAKTGVLYSIERSPSGETLVIGTGGVPVYRSKSVPFAWEVLEKQDQ